MQSTDKTREQLLGELEALRQRISELEASESRLREMDKALGESEQRFRLLYENAPLGYQSLDENGYFLEVNQAWLDTLGYSREEVVGKWFGDFLGLGYQERFKINFPKFKAAGEIHWVEFEMLRKDGSQISVVFDGQIGRDERGRFRQINCILHDVTERKKAQESLDRANQEWERTFNAISDLVMVLDDRHKILRANKAMADALGMTEQEVIGKSCFELVHGEKEPPAFCPHAQLLADGAEHSAEVVEPRLGGIYDVRVSPLVGQNGQVIGSVHVTRDITERKRAETELQQSNDLLRAIIEAAPTAIIGLDLAGNVQMVWNPAAEKMLGWSAQDVMGRPLPSVPVGSEEEFRRFREIIRRGKTLDGVEVRRQTLDGSPIDYSIYASPLHDAEGRISGNIAVLVDITERKRVEEALQDSEERLRLTLEATQIGIWDWDVKTDQWYASPIYYSMLGYEPKTGLADRREWLERVHPDDRACVNEKIQAVLTRDFKEYEYEARLRHADGTYRWQHVRGFGIKRDEDQKVTRMLGIGMDITERKRAENIMLARFRLVEHATSHSLDELLQTTLDEVEALTDSSIGFYHFVEADQETLRLQAWSTRTLREMCTTEGKGLHYDISEAGVWVDCVHKRKPVIHNDYSALPHRKGMPAGHANVIRELVVPVFRGDRLVAVLGVGNKPAAYGASDIETVSLLADLAWDIAERKLAEDALRAASLYNRSLIEASLDPLVTISAHGKITDVNAATEQVTGYSRDELIGTDFADYFTDREKAGSGYEQAFKEGAVKDYELEIRHRDGDLTPVIYNASVYYDHFGKVAGLFAAARNITKQKRAEQALRDSEEQYRAVFHNAGIGIKVLNRDRRINRANPALLNMLGYSEAELRELTPVDGTHPDDREMTNQYLDAVLGDGPDSLRLAKRYIRKDGSAIWGDVSISAMRDAQGNRTTALEVIADITDRTKSQIALQESETRMRRIIDSSPVGIRITQDGRHVYANRALARTFGYESQEEILGLPSEALFAPESRALIGQRVADRMAGKTIPHHYEASGMTRHGKTIALESWGTEIDYLGKKSWLAFIIDISEAKSLRAQLLHAQKMEAVGTLAGGIAHDFNNILQVVLGFSEILLMDKGEGDREHEDIQKILSAGRKGADLVQRLLTFSRKAETNPKPLNLNHQIQRVESLLERTIPKIINIDLILADGLSAITADPTQIEQVLMNLSVNARDAMPEGGRLIFETSNVTLDELYCNTHLGSKPGDYVLLTVSDTGEGMDKNTLEHIFEPFFSTKATGKGTGLGLAMVYGIVKQHNGYVTCYSEPGVGTTFKLYFPITEMKSESSVQHGERRLPGGAETILVVDDEDLVRELGKRILSRAGYTVLAAANGREALQTYGTKSQTISLIVLDLIMPEMDGKQCLRELLRINPGAKVLVASGFSAEGSTKEALEGGARGFVGKPYDMGQLLQTVRKALDET